MKYLIAIMVLIGFIAFVLVGCSPYRSKGYEYQSKHTSKVSEQPFTDYNMGEFEDVIDLTDHTDVYHVKYVHIIL